MYSKTELNLDILEAIFGTKILDVEFLRKQIKTNSSYLLSELELYRIFDEDETKVIDLSEANSFEITLPYAGSFDVDAQFLGNDNFEEAVAETAVDSRGVWGVRFSDLEVLDLQGG